MGKGAVATYHPAVTFGCFLLLLLLGMCLSHPFFVVCSLLGAVSYAVCLTGKAGLSFALKAALPVALLTAVFNPVFNHQGVTVLFTWHDHAYTKEAMVFGLVYGLLFAAVLLWCYCYGKVMTSEKLLAVFGNRLPRTALLFVMTLRLIPRYRRRIREVAEAAEGLYGTPEAGKLRESARRFSIVLTWAMESAVVQADSMQARGYGKGRRSHYAPYIFRQRDGILSAALLALFGIILAGWLQGACKAVYLPEIVLAVPVGWQYLAYAAYVCLCFIPLVLEGKEALAWRRRLSKA